MICFLNFAQVRYGPDWQSTNANQSAIWAGPYKKNVSDALWAMGHSAKIIPLPGLEPGSLG